MRIVSPNALLRSLSLRGKIIAVLFLVTFVALGAGFSVVVISNVRLFKDETVNTAEHLAAVVAESTIAALTFEDRRGAEQMLENLITIPSVTSAAVFDDEDKPFARYLRAGDQIWSPSTLDSVRTGFHDDYLETTHRVTHKGDFYGTVFLRLSTAELDAKINAYIATIALIFVGVLSLCLLLAFRLERVLSRPILKLAKIANTVSHQGDYSVRVASESTDEIGQLYDAFNSMLDQVESRQRERDKAEAALRDNEAKYRAVVEDQTELIRRISVDGSIAFVNGAFCRYYGKTASEIIGTRFSPVIHPEDRERVDTELSSLGSTKLYTEYECRVILGPDDVRWHRWTNRAIFDEDSQLVEIMGVGRDVTELKEAEEERSRLSRQLEHSQRLETIGTLAGGIAHDFNNILTPIMGCLQLAKMDIPESAEAYGQLEIALQSADRARELVRQILTFSRHGDHEFELVRVQDVADQALKLLRGALPATIAVETDIDPNCRPVFADGAQLHQILVNLCTNAFHAMSDHGGRLRVTLHPVNLRSPEIPDGSGLRPGPHVRLTVEDTGMGMAEDTRQRMFEPFFTTKPTGQGTGLGLSVVHGVISKHGGHISVESTLGVGTTFRILLPESRNEAPVSQVEDAPAERGTGSILVVDDELLVARVTRRLLESLGYSVRSSNSAADALEIFVNDPDRFDLVITDQTMPGMTGLELARKMVEIKPDVKIVLASGYSVDAPSDSETRELGIVGRLGKPFTIEEISQLLHRVGPKAEVSRLERESPHE